MFSGLVLALVLAASLSASETAAQGRNAASNFDIKEFFSTEDVTWTYNTTRSTSYYCIGDVKHNITNANVVFTKYSRLNTSTVETIATHLNGTFYKDTARERGTKASGKSRYNAMRIAYLDDGEPFWKEVLMFQTKDMKCGVFMVLRRGRNPETYDLRLKNSSVEGGPDTTCLKQFISLAKGEQGHVLYSSHCQEMLQGLNNAPGAKSASY
uniref:Putative group i salivary lipocalin n=1 Tax=Rhipicephalus pulchellus TaxID=72859 RepID=L7LTG5_RHIPC